MKPSGEAPRMPLECSHRPVELTSWCVCSSNCQMAVASISIPHWTAFTPETPTAMFTAAVRQLTSKNRQNRFME